MNDDRLQACATTIDTAELADWALTPEQIDAGNPHPRGAIVWRSSDRTRAAGFWECTAGRFSRTYPWSETAVILSGSAVVKTVDAEHRLQPGSLLVLPLGIRASWIIEDRVEKAFHLSGDGPLPI